MEEQICWQPILAYMKDNAGMRLTLTLRGVCKAFKRNLQSYFSHRDVRRVLRQEPLSRNVFRYGNEISLIGLPHFRHPRRYDITHEVTSRAGRCHVDYVTGDFNWKRYWIKMELIIKRIKFNPSKDDPSIMNSGRCLGTMKVYLDGTDGQLVDKIEFKARCYSGSPFHLREVKLLPYGRESLDSTWRYEYLRRI